MDDLLAQTEDEPPGSIVRELINNSRMARSLRERGYETNSVSSGFEQVALREADRFVDTGQVNEFEIAVLKRSLVGHVLEWIAPDAVSAQERDRIHGGFEAVASAPSWIGPGPQFVFAHIRARTRPGLPRRRVVEDRRISVGTGWPRRPTRPA